MGALQNIGYWMGFSTRTEANQNMTIDQLAEMMADGTVSSSGESVSARSAESLAAVGACVRILSRVVAKTPINLHRDLGQGRKELAEGDALHKLLREEPNQYQTPLQLKSMMQRDYELRGNAYAQIVRGFGDRPVALLRRHPDRCRPKMGNDGVVRYHVRNADGSETVFEPEEMLHLWDWSDDGVIGISPVQAYRETIGKGLAQRRHGSKFFANGASPSGFLKVAPGKKMSPESQKALGDDFSKLYGGTDNAYATAVIPDGVDYEQVSLSNVDAQYIEATKMTANEVAMVWGVPPHKIGILERATFNNIEHQSIEFVRDAIEPRTCMWEECLNQKLVGGGAKRYFSFDLDRALMGDMKTVAETHNMYRRMGVYNANEVRARLGLNPRADEGGDDYIIERNMALNDGTDPGQETKMERT